VHKDHAPTMVAKDTVGVRWQLWKEEEAITHSFALSTCRRM